MLGTFRGVLNTWPARLFFLLLAAAFALWGVANKNPFGGDPTALATVAGQTIELPQAQQAFRKQMEQVQRAMGSGAQIPAQMRRAVAVQSVERLITQAAMQARVRKLGLLVPDSALREAAFAIPQFHGANGQFDHKTMLAVLQQNGFTEASFLDLLRHDLGQRQLLGAVTAGSASSKLLDDRLFAFLHETRTADAVDFAFAAAAAPPAPTDAQLHRFHDNHPTQYSSPEYRRIKAVVLSPETVARDITISGDELRAAYEQHKSEYVTPPRRSVQVLTAPDEATAQKLDLQWTTGADWAAMQKAAQDAGATAVELDAATRAEFPAPELADAAFATNPDTVAPPVRGALGWYVVKVVKAEPGGTQGFEAARAALRARIVAEKASDLIDQRSVKIDDLLQGGTTLDQLPGDLGLGAVTGTLDAKGNTPEGVPAPIPGSASLRAALVAAAFQAHKGDPLKLQQAPAEAGATSGYFAISVEDILPPAPRPFEKVAPQVRADWTADQRKREQDAAATRLMTEAQAGAGLAAAAKQAGLAVHRLPAVTRGAQVDGVPQGLVAPLFGMRKGETTMVGSNDGFTVATLAAIDDPDPKSDPVGHARLVEQLDQQIAQDTQASFTVAVRDRARPQVNQALVDQLVQPAE